MTFSFLLSLSFSSFKTETTIEDISDNVGGFGTGCGAEEPCEVECI